MKGNRFQNFAGSIDEDFFRVLIGINSKSNKMQFLFITQLVLRRF